MIDRSFIVSLKTICVFLLLSLSALAQKPVSPKPTPPPTPTLFARNLIKNSDAESGNGGGWSNSLELKTILYGDLGGGPGKESPGPSNRGERYFYARTTTSQPIAVFLQKTDINSAAAAIDGGGVTYRFGGWFGTANGSSSAGRLKITFLDAAGKELKNDATPEIKEENRPPDETMIEKSSTGIVPPGTRMISISLEFKIFERQDEERDNLAFADSLWLILTNTGDK